MKNLKIFLIENGNTSFVLLNLIKIEFNVLSHIKLKCLNVIVAIVVDQDGKGLAQMKWSKWLSVNVTAVNLIKNAYFIKK